MNAAETFTWEIIYRKSGKTEGEAQGVRITSVNPEEEYVPVPEQIGGLPVLELGSYAMKNSRIRELQLPECLQKIGRYAFYNCEKLERISLYDGLKDIGTGAFTGVHRVHSIHLTQKQEGGRQAVLQELLSDFAETIEVTLTFPGKEVHLLFPEYYEQGVENTPARIIVNQFYGTGMKYRNCFVNRTLQYEEYDSLFPLAAAGERMETVMELALMRLRWPYSLKENNRQRYLDWIRDQAQEILPVLIREKRLEDLRLILEEAELSEQIKNQAALLCADKGFPDAVSLFMESKNREFNQVVRSVGSEENVQNLEKPDENTEDQMQEKSEKISEPVIYSSFNLDEI